MKTSKIMLMVAFLTFGTMLLTQAAPDSPVVKIKITEALQNQGLVKAMHAQLSLNDVLRSENNGLCCARVVYNHTVYEIYGTKKQWVAFFLGGDPNSPSIGREVPPEG
ncbi:MAG: hypothetical protein JW731_07325 [Bacteroidales bacterium]|nr:hypothetical protein [Bacteroidales bacterium]